MIQCDFKVTTRVFAKEGDQQVWHKALEPHIFAVGLREQKNCAFQHQESSPK